MIAGPSEILIIADSTCNPKFVAADLLSQAEHDKNASAVLVTDSMKLAEMVSDEIESQISELPRYEIARSSIDVNGKIIVAENNIKLAIDIANEIAPEHLELCVDKSICYLEQLKHAGLLSFWERIVLKPSEIILPVQSYAPDKRNREVLFSSFC